MSVYVSYSFTHTHTLPTQSTCYETVSTQTTTNTYECAYFDAPSLFWVKCGLCFIPFFLYFTDYSLTSHTFALTSTRGVLLVKWMRHFILYFTWNFPFFLFSYFCIFLFFVVCFPQINLLKTCAQPTTATTEHAPHSLSPQPPSMCHFISLSLSIYLARCVCPQRRLNMPNLWLRSQHSLYAYLHSFGSCLYMCPLSFSFFFLFFLLQSCCPNALINCRTSFRAAGGGHGIGGGQRRANGARNGSAELPNCMNSTASSEIQMNVMRARQYAAGTPTTTGGDPLQLHPLYTNWSIWTLFALSALLQLSVCVCRCSTQSMPKGK